MIPRLKPSFGTDELHALFTAGAAESDFEKSISRAFDAAEAVSYLYARTALHELIRAFELAESEILIPAYTCEAVPQAVLAAGAIPVICDVEAEDLQVVASTFRAARGPKTRAAIITPLFGIAPAAPEELLSATEGLVRIVDAALAPGLLLAGKSAASFGDAAIYSFNYGKTFCALTAGAAATNNAALAEQLRSRKDAAFAAPRIGAEAYWKCFGLAGAALLRAWSYGLVAAADSAGLLGNLYHRGDELPNDAFTRITRTQASVGAAQLERAAVLIEEHRRRAALYFDLLRGVDGIALPPNRPGSTWTHFPIRVSDRRTFIERMKTAGISVGSTWDYSLSSLPIMNRGRRTACPESEEAARTIVTLPTLASLSLQEIELVARAAKEACGG